MKTNNNQFCINFVNTCSRLLSYNNSRLHDDRPWICNNAIKQRKLSCLQAELGQVEEMIDVSCMFPVA